MVSGTPALESTTRLLRSRANMYAVWGVVIAGLAALVATFVIGYMRTGSVSLAGFAEAQATNPALWLLDAMPFLFAIWGQYTGTMMAYRAGAMVLDETRDLRAQASALEYQLKHGAHQGRLVDLPDERRFRQAVGRALSQAEEELHLVAVLSIDFNQFHELRNTLARADLDELIRQLAARLQGAVREHDLVAHMGGDEFAVLLPRLQRGADLRRITRRLHQVLKAPAAIAGHRLSARPGIGVAVAPRDGSDAASLIRNAEIGRQTARGRSEDFAFFSPGMEDEITSSMNMVADLRDALDSEILSVEFQPQQEAHLERPRYVKARLGWSAPGRGYVDEETVFALAERGGFVYDVLLWELNRVMEQLRRWEDERGLALRAMLSLPDSSLTELPLAELLTGLMASYDLRADRLTLEVTETALDHGGPAAMEQLRALRGRGIRLGLADFGGPRSSVSVLMSFQFNDARISERLTGSLPDSTDALVILEGLVSMAARLKVSTVVPGVASKRTAELLGKLVCDRLEGSYVQRPMPAEELEGWLELQSTDRNLQHG